MRGLVLAAGLGTRLRPLTDTIPKPLLPVIARPLIEHAFSLLHSAGILDIAVNTHHLPQLFDDLLRDGTCFSQRVTISHEMPEVLGTGGAIKKLRSFLEKSDPLIVTNGDTMSRPDLAAAVEAHRKSGAIATMILRRDERAVRFGAVEADETGVVVDIAGLLKKKGSASGLFIGTHVISPEIFRHMPEENIFCIIRQVYVPLIKTSSGAVRGHFTDAPFFDLGTPRDYAETQFELMRSLRGTFPHAFIGLAEKGESVFLSPSARIHPDAVLVGPCAVCADAIIEAGARIGPDAVIGAGAKIGMNSRVRQSVVLPGSVIEMETLSRLIHIH